MSTSPRADAYRSVLAHLQDSPPVVSTTGLPGTARNGWLPAQENARLWSAVKVALDAAGVPAITGSDGWPEVPV